MTDRIVRIEAFPVLPRWLFVRLETAQRAVLWGEATLEGHAESVTGAIDAARDRLIGHDPDRVEDAWQLPIASITRRPNNATQADYTLTPPVPVTAHNDYNYCPP